MGHIETTASLIVLDSSHKMHLHPSIIMHCIYQYVISYYVAVALWGSGQSSQDDLRVLIFLHYPHGKREDRAVVEGIQWDRQTDKHTGLTDRLTG